MEELINKAIKGDEKAFSSLILAIDDDLYKIARTRLADENDIDEAIQDTMIEAYKSLKKLRDFSKFKNWIIKILINKCNKIYRKKRKNDISIEEFDIKDSSISDINKLEDNLNFYSLIGCLNYEERIIVILYYMEEYSVKEIKDIIKMNENTINTHLYRARKKIKNKYYGGKV